MRQYLSPFILFSILFSTAKGQSQDTLNRTDANGLKQGWWKIYYIKNDTSTYAMGVYKNGRMQGEWINRIQGRYGYTEFYNDGWWYKTTEINDGITVVSGYLNATKDTVIDCEYYIGNEPSRRWIEIGINDSTYKINMSLGGESFGLKELARETYDYRPFKNNEDSIVKLTIYSTPNPTIHAPPLYKTIYYKLEKNKKTILFEFDKDDKLVKGTKEDFNKMWNRGWADKK